MGGEFLTGAIFAGAALALMFTPYAGIVKIAAAAAGAIIGAIAGYRAEKPMTGDKKMEAIMLGAQLLGLGLYAPPAIAFIAGAIAATPILRLIDKIRGR